MSEKEEKEMKANQDEESKSKSPTPEPCPTQSSANCPKQLPETSSPRVDSKNTNVGHQRGSVIHDLDDKSVNEEQGDIPSEDKSKGIRAFLGRKKLKKTTYIYIHLGLVCITLFAVLIFVIIKVKLTSEPIEILDPNNRNQRYSKCRPLRVAFCNRFRVQYSYTRLPNALGYVNQDSINGLLQQYDPLISVKCYPLLPLFLCSLFAPKCNSSFQAIPPCKSVCKEALRRCSFFLSVFSLDWKSDINCDEYPDNPDPDICVGYQENQLLQRRVQICGSDGFRCDFTRCIPKSWVCDGFIDCQDLSDEKNCSNCTSSQFHCGKGFCIDKDDICDGLKDCPDGRDEKQCLRLKKQMGNIGEGKLEAWSAVNNKWRTVCGENWDTTVMSHKACKMLGYSKAIETRIRDEIQPPSVQNRLAAQHLQQPAKSLFYKGRNKACAGNSLAVYLKCEYFECGRPAHFYTATSRIVGGIESYPGHWPWLAGLHGGPDEVFFCGGILISRDWVLTAAHCVGNQTDVTGWTVKLGLTRRTAFPLFVRKKNVTAIIKHYSFNSINLYSNDIALLLLDKPTDFDEFLRPVCLPKRDHLKPSTNCTVIGWGKPKHDDDADYLNVIHEVRVPIINHTVCAEWYSLQDITIAPTMLCAGYAEGKKDACQGDSGGPLLCKDEETESWFVAGVVSWGINCAQPQLPGIYTNVALFKEWIMKTTAAYGKPIVF